MKRVIDARKLDCPKPVLLVKKALSDGGFTFLEILVDNIAARDNVSRFLEKSGVKVAKVNQAGADFTITTEKLHEGDVIQEKKKKLEGKTLFIASKFLGLGSDDLGEKLMKAFTYTLTELDNPPKCILFMNSGVELCLEGADTLKNLQHLEKGGTEILVCGTCLDFFGLTDKLAVGKISNMYDIAGHLIDDKEVVKV